MINTPLRFTLAMVFIIAMFAIAGHLEFLDHCAQGHVVGGR